ncbi:carboxylesterase [Amanita muscaria]
MGDLHLHDELRQNTDRVSVLTQYGPITGGRAANGAAVFLEVPYALPPRRFADPEPLPAEYRYGNKEFISEASYAVQPTNDGQADGTRSEDKVGFGEPTENTLFLNIVAPPAFPSQKRFPVKVYIHGGYLQFGSPHSLMSQAQYVAAERSEVWVNIAYRLSAFGFLASDQPHLDGNYGFKDQWLALQWINANIEAFGGDPDNIQIQGLSAGAHSVHQLLHHASCLPEGKKAPFQSAVLQSNAILADPRTPAELRLQFQALCKALKLDPDSPDILATLRDPAKVPWHEITRVIETDVLETKYQVFRGCLSSDWIITSPGPMARQRTGEFSRKLKQAGVRSIVIGEVSEEWFIYSLTHPISSARDLLPSLLTLFNAPLIHNVLQCFKNLPENASIEEVKKYYGEVLSAAQVYIPARLLHRDLCAAGFPVLRYRIEWAPEQLRQNGYVSHASDRAIWTLRIPSMTADQAQLARSWLETFYSAVDGLQTQEVIKDSNTVLKLTRDREIKWAKDDAFDAVMDKFEEL